MAIRYKSGFNSTKEIVYDIEIHDSAYSGAVTDFILGPNGFTKTWRGDDDDRHCPIIGCEVKFDLYVQDASFETLIFDIGTAQEGRFSCVIYRNSVLFFAGQILADNAKLENAAFPYVFTVSATDGIGLLKGIPYNNAGTAYDGLDAFVSHIQKALSKLTHIPTHYNTGAVLFKTAVDWWSVQSPATPASSVDPLAIHGVGHETFYKYEKGKKDFASCYDVLKKICTSFGARLWYNEGTYWIVQIAVHTAAFYGRSYDRTGAYLTVITYSSGNTIDQTTNGAILDGASTDWLPALKKVDITYNAKNRFNALEGENITESYTGNPYLSVESSTGESVLKFSGHIAGWLSSWPTNSVIVLKFQAKIKVGDKYCTRGFFLQNGAVIYDQPTWQDGVGYVEIAVMFSFAPQTSPVYSFHASFDFLSAPIPASGTMEFGFQLVGAQKIDGTFLSIADYTYEFGVDTPRLEVFSDGNPAEKVDSVIYSTQNSVSGNSAIVETDIAIADGTESNSVSRIRHIPTLTDTALWGAGTATRNKPLAQLLAITVIGGQLAPTARINATIFGAFTFWKTYSIEGDPYLLMSGRFNARMDEIQGVFVRLAYGTGYNTTTPIKVKTITGTFDIGTTTTSNGQPEKVGSATNVLSAVSAGSTAAGLVAGPVTIVPVATPLAAGAVSAGDQITVINPISGQSTTLTVTKTAAAGDTYIQTSGNATQSIPTGSYIIRNPAFPTAQAPVSPSAENPIWWTLFGQLFQRDATLPIPWEMELDTELETDRNAGNGSTAGLRFSENGLYGYDATTANARSFLSAISGLWTLWAATFQNNTGTDVDSGKLEYQSPGGDAYAFLSYGNGSNRFPIFGHTLFLQCIDFATDWTTGSTKAFFTVGIRYAGLKIQRVYITVRSIGTGAVLQIQKSGSTQATQTITGADHTVTINQTLSSGDIWSFNVSNAGSPAAKGLNIEIELSR
jgi:hypothetical protein